MAKFQSLKGFRDFYPEDFAKRAFVTDTWRRIAKSYGFEEYDAPPLESLDLYRHKSGEELVSQLYSFVDKGGREVAMRPEMTPSVARMIAERWQALPKPIRWFSIPQLFRYERPQAGRLREHFQFNVDVFGDATGLAEAEILALVIDAFVAFGLKPEDVQIRISDRRVLNTLLRNLGAREEQFPAVYSVLDKYQREERSAALKRLLEAGLSDEFATNLFATIERYRNIKRRQEFIAEFGESNQFTVMHHYLEGLVADHNKWLTFDLTIVRGLGYYTGTVFEAFDTRGEYRAICGGGRYDGLLESLGGAAAPAVGFGWGDVVLTEMLSKRGDFSIPKPRVDWFVAGGNDYLEALRTSRRLREMGFTVLTGRPNEAPKASPRGYSAAFKTSRFTWTLRDDLPAHFQDNEAGISFEHPSYELALQHLSSIRLTNNRPPTPAEVRTAFDGWRLRGSDYR